MSKADKAADEAEARHERLKDILDGGETPDLYAEALKQPGVDAMLEDLTPEQQDALEDQVRQITNGWENILEEIYGAVNTEEGKRQFIEMAIKRYSKM